MAVIVQEIRKDEFRQITGNPVLMSFDGKRKARLQAILHPSWTDEDRAAFGIYVVREAEIPDGMVAAAGPFYSHMDGRVVQTYELADAKWQHSRAQMDMLKRVQATARKMDAHIVIAGLALPVIIEPDGILVGCEKRTLKGWQDYADEQALADYGPKHLEWWKRHRDAILALAESLDPSQSFDPLPDERGSL